MKSLKAQRAIRRANVARLMDQYGQTGLAEMTGIAAAYLFQMSKAVGKQARGVNDDYARLLEQKIPLPDGWMDIDHENLTAVALDKSMAAHQVAVEKSAHGWPFPSIKFKRWESLLPAQRAHIEEEVERMLRLCEASVPSPRKKTVTKAAGQRRAAG